MTDDLKNFVAPPPIWPQVLFAVVLGGLAVAAMVIQDNAERPEGAERSSEWTGSPESRTGKPVPSVSVSAPYIPCKKLRDGKWLRSEIAHWRKDGWEITCSYWGQELMTREEMKL